MKKLELQVEGVRGFRRKAQQGKIGWALLWIMGVPIPILGLLFLLRGCN